MVVNDKREFFGGGIILHCLRRQEDPDPCMSGRVKWNIFGEDWGEVGGRIRCGGGAWKLEETRNGAVRVWDDLEVVVGINGGV